MSSTATIDGPFVGRQQELTSLLARFDEVRQGRGGVALLAGEAGIGKTRTARAFADAARQRGALVLWGRCFEGEWSPPFAPWVEAIGSFVRGADPEPIREALGLEETPGATPLSELIPDLAPFVADLPGLVALGPDEERFRLYDAVVRFLLRLAATRPVVVVLDDLHWADGASLDLLRHLAHFIGQGPVLVVGAYRDLELDAKHPLTQLLPLLRRETSAAPITLRGLPLAEVSSLLGGENGRNGRAALARTIHEQTNGNPFFIEELVRHLSEEGALVRDDEGWGARVDVTELGIPEGVRQTVARRLARLSPDAERLLTHAAVFTGGFDFAVLPALTELPEEALLDAIDEALAARLLQPAGAGPERYDFVHAIVRQALAESWSPSRRVRIHRRAAEALAKTYAGHEREHASELAVQYHRSSSLPGAEAGIPHALAAADAARRGHARDQAVIFLRMARDLAADAATTTRADILTRLAIAEAEAVMIDDARRSTEDALTVRAESGSDPSATADFLATVANALKWRAGADMRVWRPLVERGLELVRERHDRAWARLMLQVDPIEPVSRETIRAGRWLGFDPEAVEILRAVGDEEDYARTVESFDARTRAETDAYVARARTWSRPTAVIQALTVAANDFQYRHGAFRDAAALWEEIIAMSERVGAIAWQAQAWNQLTGLHIAGGRFVEARESEARANALLARLGPGRRSHVLATEMATLFAVYLGGDWSSIARFWTRWVDDPGMGPNDLGTLAGSLFGALAALAHVLAGSTDDARRLVVALTPILERMDPRASNQNHNGAVSHGAWVVWLLGATDLASAYRRFGLDLLSAGIGDHPQGSNHLAVARMATLLGNRDEATEHFSRAREIVSVVGQDPLRAIVDLDEAKGLAHDGDGDLGHAAALVDHALETFEALAMPPWVEQARARQAVISQKLGAARAILPGGVTEREADVLRLVARGYSDRQISEALFISPRTVNAHLRNMLTKTDSANRTELSVWAFEHGLVSRGDHADT